MSEEKRASTRRGFLLGLLAGAGAFTAVGTASNSKEAAAVPRPGAKQPHDPILYRRTEESERYYRTLYN